MLMFQVVALVLAQWFTVTLPNTPRMPDGKANLTAPAPKTPDGKTDLSGIWRVGPGGYLLNIAKDLGEAPFQPWAAALYKARADGLGKGRPSEFCIPHGIPDGMLVRNSPFKIVQTRDVVVVLYEEFNHFRQIFTDGRGLPPETTESWFGYSVGKWDNDTLVAETIGFNDKSWFDDPGHPHSDALRVTERFRRRDFGHLDIGMTYDDPKMYARPFTISISHHLLADDDIFEMFSENEKDCAHIVTKK